MAILGKGGTCPHHPGKTTHKYDDAISDNSDVRGIVTSSVMSLEQLGIVINVDTSTGQKAGALFVFMIH